MRRRAGRCRSQSSSAATVPCATRCNRASVSLASGHIDRSRLGWIATELVGVRLAGGAAPVVPCRAGHADERPGPACLDDIATRRPCNQDRYDVNALGRPAPIRVFVGAETSASLLRHAFPARRRRSPSPSPRRGEGARRADEGWICPGPRPSTALARSGGYRRSFPETGPTCPHTLLSVLPGLGYCCLPASSPIRPISSGSTRTPDASVSRRGSDPPHPDRLRFDVPDGQPVAGPQCLAATSPIDRPAAPADIVRASRQNRRASPARRV